jgi:hypothetical protein
MNKGLVEYATYPESDESSPEIYITEVGPSI